MTAPTTGLSPAAATNPAVTLNGTICPRGGLCVAVGSYADSLAHTQGLVETLTGGGWTSITAPTSGLSPAPGLDPTVTLRAAACPSAGGCIGVGSYHDTLGNTWGLIEQQSNGSWTAMTAPTSGLSPAAGTNPTISLPSVSCPASSRCVAVGSYKDTSGNTDGLTETLVSSWTAQTAQTTSLSPAASATPVVVLKSVSCAGPGSCVAVGSYHDTVGNTQGLNEVLAVGTWTPTAAPTGGLSPSAGLNPTAVVTNVSCPLSGSCTAVGTYVDAATHTQGLLEALSAGTWTATSAPLAGLSPAAGANPTLAVHDLSCPTVTQCVTVGSYLDASSNTRGLIGTFGQPPIVTRVRPAYGSPTGGTRVRISGRGFLGATAVNFGSTAATSFHVNKRGTTITAIAPAGTGLVFVTVVAPLGVSADVPAAQFDYEPTVVRLRPTSGTHAGGGRVVIAGTNFLGATAVHFGSMPATSFSVRSSRAITAVAPAAAVGSVNVTVTTPGGTSPVTAADVYTYR